jgi:NhaA family Na+:H+ antiporter
VLVAAAVIALIWANAAPAGYESFWGSELKLEIGDWSIEKDLAGFTKEGLMAIFFFVVGLEIKREMTMGELADKRAAVTPLLAAVGGMVLPALIYFSVTAGSEGSEGWGIPMATDIAFALGALALISRRVPPELPAFLLAIAVIDDIGAIAVIAVFYTSDVSLPFLGAAVGVLALIWLLNRLHVRYIGVYVLLALVVWYFMFESGVSATIAGVALGLLTPRHPFQPGVVVSEEARRVAAQSKATTDREVGVASWRRLSWLSHEAVSPLNRVEHALHPWSSFVVLPIFALANAGVRLDSESLEQAASSSVTLGVILGLVVGKIVGVGVGTLIAVKTGIGRLPRGVGARHVLGIGALAGIGFTVSIFVAGLAFDGGELEDAAKVGILFGSVIAGAIGMVVLAFGPKRAARASAIEEPSRG